MPDAAATARHTPGPWHAYQAADFGGTIGYDISGPAVIGNGFTYFNAADARLIAAAPELLRVVEMMLSGDYGRFVQMDLAEAARAALAKAKG